MWKFIYNLLYKLDIIKQNYAITYTFKHYQNKYNVGSYLNKLLMLKGYDASIIQSFSECRRNERTNEYEVLVVFRLTQTQKLNLITK